jgi:SAM-dependent methyltransferase
MDDHARVAYESLAPFYDEFTSHHDYELWTRALEGLARAEGLRGNRLLDIACGTGKSFLPFLARGYAVTACDISPAMVSLAAAKADGRAQLHVADMRELPRLGAFDLVTVLDDALNYLLTQAELEAALQGVARNLAPGGVAVFDTNTLMAYRALFASASVVVSDGRVQVWRGRASRDFGEGELAEAEHTGLERREDGWWTATDSRHRQRHHTQASVRRALDAAGLELAALHGMHLDGTTDPGCDEIVNSKAVYIARKGGDA